MKILIEQNAAIKLKYYIKFADGEISGIGKSHKDEETDNIIVTDFILFKQKCTSANTDLDEEDMAKFMYELSKKKESLKNWNVWWHSHANMGVFWSGTDSKTIIDHTKQGHDHLVSIVSNKKGEFKGRLDIFPVDTSGFDKVVFATFDLDVEQILDKDIKEFSDKKIKELEDIKRELKNEYEELLKNANNEIANIKESLFENDDIKNACEKEVKDKVIEKKYNFQKSFYNKNYKSNDDYYYDYWDWGYKKKEEKKSFEEKFEKVLDEIINPKDEIGFKYINKDNEYNVDYCPECQNPIDACICDRYPTENEEASAINNLLNRERF